LGRAEEDGKLLHIEPFRVGLVVYILISRRHSHRNALAGLGCVAAAVSGTPLPDLYQQGRFMQSGEARFGKAPSPCHSRQHSLMIRRRVYAVGRSIRLDCANVRISNHSVKPENIATQVRKSQYTSQHLFSWPVQRRKQPNSINQN